MGDPEKKSGGFFAKATKKVATRLGPQVVRRYSTDTPSRAPDRPWHEQGTIEFRGSVSDQQYRHVASLMLEVGKLLRGQRKHLVGTKYDKRSKELCIVVDDKWSAAEQSMLLRYAHDFARQGLCTVLGWDDDGSLVLEALKK